MKLTEKELADILARHARKSKPEGCLPKEEYVAPTSEPVKIPVTIDGLTKEAEISNDFLDNLEFELVPDEDNSEEVLPLAKIDKQHKCECEKKAPKCPCTARDLGVTDETFERLEKNVDEWSLNSLCKEPDFVDVSKKDVPCLLTDDELEHPNEKTTTFKPDPVDECLKKIDILDPDFDVPEWKDLKAEEKKEIVDLLQRSRRLKSLYMEDTSKPITLLDLEQDTGFGLYNPSLIKKWKHYKEDVQAYLEKHPGMPRSIAEAFLLDEYPEENPVDGRPWNVQEFEKITKQMYDTYVKKNADYGSSFDELYDEYGMTSVLIRLKDKYNRVKSLSFKEAQVTDESIEDTLLDLANYAILTVIKRRQNKK